MLRHGRCGNARALATAAPALATAALVLGAERTWLDLAAVRHERAQENDGGPKRRHRAADGLLGPNDERL